MQLREPQAVAALEQVVDPVARRVQLEPVAGIRRDERAPAAVLLHTQLGRFRPRERALELLLVEREPEMVDARQRPLPGLDDDVDRAELELRETQLEARSHRAPSTTRPASYDVRSSPIRPCRAIEVEAELADVARLDFAHPARDEVVVEEMHAAEW